MHHRYKAVLLSFIGSCAVALSGCSDPKAKVAGTYEVDKAAIKAAAEADLKAKGDNNPDAMAAGFIMGMIDAMTMTMTLNVDGNATMQVSMMGDTDTTNGTWTLSGDSISITTVEDGKDETISGTVSSDTITLKPPKEEKMPFDLVFRRKSA